MTSAPGPMPLVSNPEENETSRILGAVFSMTILSLTTVLARAYVRAVIIRNLGWDDYIMFFTTALAVVGAGVVAGSCAYGAGKHAGDLSTETRVMGLKLNFISQPIYMVAICTVKLAVGASLLRIASTKFYRITILSIMGFVAFYTTGSFITVFTQCTDIRVQWNPTIPSVCYSKHTLQSLSYTSNALNITTDLLLAIVIPAPMLWGLNVNMRIRLTLIGILSLGIFACSAAFVKLGYIVNYGKVGDFLWDSRNITIWTAAELNTGIMAGSMPALRPLFKRILGSTYGRGTRKTGQSGSNFKSNTRSSRVGKQWRTLSSGVRPGADDGASQTGFRDADLEGNYELDRMSGSGDGNIKTVIMSETLTNKSSDGLEAERPQSHNGIRATTVTRIEIEPKGMGSNRF